MNTKAPNVAMYSRLAELVAQNPNPATGEPYNANQLQNLTGLSREALGKWMQPDYQIGQMSPRFVWALGKFFGIPWWEVVRIVEVES